MFLHAVVCFCMLFVVVGLSDTIKMLILSKTNGEHSEPKCAPVKIYKLCARQVACCSEQCRVYLA